jgi:hypothetical protein
MPEHKIPHLEAPNPETIQKPVKFGSLLRLGHVEINII